MKEDNASATAFDVMQGILFVADDVQYPNIVPASLAESCRRLMGKTALGKKRLAQLQSPWRRKLFRLKERVILPGIALHFVMRKRLIEDFTVEQISLGTTQVINLGAGFDTLLSRLADEHPDVNFIELDHPATQFVKSQSLQINERSINNLHLLPIHFENESLEETLLGSSCFDKKSKTVYILEGVLMYLKEDAVAKTFQAFSSIGNPNIIIIFTALDSFNAFLRCYLKFKGEPLEWICGRKSIHQFFNSFNYNICNTFLTDDLKHRYLPPNFNDILQHAEYVAVAKPNAG